MEYQPDAAVKARLSRESAAVVVILGTAFLFRLIYLMFYARQMPFYSFPVGDSAIYLDWARAIVGGDFWGRGELYRVFYYSPLYPYLLALSLKVFGSSLLPVYIAQMLLGLLNLLLVWIITRRLFSPLAGFIALGLAALYAPLTFEETKLVSVTLVTTLLLAAAWLLARAQEKRQRGGSGKGGNQSRLLARAQEKRPRLGWFLAGLCTGVATLAWGGTIVFAPLLVVFWLLQRPRPRFALPGLFLLAWFVAVLPATLHNAFAGHDWVLINSSSGYTFYLGNNSSASGIMVNPPEVYEKPYNGRFATAIEDQQGFELAYASEKLRPVRPGEQQELVRPSQASSFWLRRGLDFIIRNPAAFFRLEFRKLVLSFSNLEFASNYFLDVEKAEVPVLHVAFVPFALIFALGLVGMGFFWRDRGRQWPMYLFIVGTFLTLMVFFVCLRYRLPLVPPLAVFAGGGGARLLERWRAHKPATAVTAAAAVLFVLSFILFSVPFKSTQAFVDSFGFRNLGEIWFWQAGDTARAIKAYDKALAIEQGLPGFGADALSATSGAETHWLRGDALLATRDYDRALSDFRAALNLAPRTPEPLDGLAHTFYAAARVPGRNPAEAGALLDSAARYALAWERAGSAGNQPLTLLDDILAARGDVARALAAADALTRADSANAAALVAAGDALVGRGDTAAARPYFARAAALDTLAIAPALYLAALATRGGDNASAAAELSAVLARVERNRRFLDGILHTPAAGLYYMAKLRLSAACLNLNEWDQARQQAEAVLKLVPGHKTAQQLLNSAKDRKVPEDVRW